MQQPPVDKAVSPVPHRSGRSKLIGTIVAIAAMIGLGWLAWHLTHPADAAPAAGGGQRAAGGG
ncbi:MAG: Efflux transporter periplasmic adaptor subunit, partial [Massilia sp.]|nr:Efflux transporter periplasmic adaptor subunit [Massilia sp.]